MKSQLLLTTFLLLLLTACSKPEAENLSPEEIVAQSANRMANTAGFQFNINLSGLPVALDNAGTLSLGNTEGFYVAPDRALADVKVLAPGLVTQVSLITIGEEQWLSGLVGDEWIALPPEWGFNPASIIDSQTGVLSTLTKDLSDLSFVGTEKIQDGPDIDLYIIQANLDGARLGEMSQGILGPGELTIQLMIAPETFELYRVIITEPKPGVADDNGKDFTIWQIDFSRIDETLEIMSPN